MTIPTPDSGTIIDAADVTAMHDVLRNLVNSIQTNNIERHALGPQHLPSAVVGRDYVCVTTEYTIYWKEDRTHALNDRIDAETVADIQSGLWQTLTAYTLNNGGAGYTLPPCKVLVFFNCRVSEFGRNDTDNQLWVNVHSGINGVDTYDQRQSGMVFPNEGSTATDDPVRLIEQPISIAYVIDKTASAGNWTLNHLTVKAGLARGSSTSTSSFDAKITAGSLSFVAFYKDE